MDGGYHVIKWKNCGSKTCLHPRCPPPPPPLKMVANLEKNVIISYLNISLIKVEKMVQNTQFRNNMGDPDKVDIVR